MVGEDLDLAVKIRVAIGKWQEKYPEDEDEDVCRKTAILVSRALGMPLPPEYEEECGYEDGPQIAVAPEQGDVEDDETPQKGQAQLFVTRVQEILTDAAPEGMKAGDIIKELRKRGWEPETASINVYLNHHLASKSHIFRKVRRGYYCLQEEWDILFGDEEQDDDLLTSKPSEDTSDPPVFLKRTIPVDQQVFNSLQACFGSRTFTFEQARPFHDLSDDDLLDLLLSFAEEGKVKCFPSDVARPRSFQLVVESEPEVKDHSLRVV